MKRITAILIATLLTFSCSDNKYSQELGALQSELDSLKSLAPGVADEQIATFLTFQENNAEEAMNFYVGIFENSKIHDVQRHGKDGPAKEETILLAKFELNGSQFACSDSYVRHAWGFTPAVSNYIEFENESELERLFSKLSENGKIMMPLDNYGFSQKFGFIEDQFGVSWQLNLQ